MNLTDRKSFAGPFWVLALLIAAAATLRLAQDVFLPLVLAGLLSFLLSPLVRFLERGRIGLSDAARADACQIVRQILTDLAEPQAESSSAQVLCIPASHEGNELAGLMLAQVLAQSGVVATVLSSKLLASESVEQAVVLMPSIVCISSLPPVSTIAARALCERLRPFGKLDLSIVRRSDDANGFQLVRKRWIDSLRSPFGLAFGAVCLAALGCRAHLQLALQVPPPLSRL